MTVPVPVETTAGPWLVAVKVVVVAVDVEPTLVRTSVVPVSLGSSVRVVVDGVLLASAMMVVVVAVLLEYVVMGLVGVVCVLGMVFV